MSGAARLERDGRIVADGETIARVVAWNPPMLLLERDGALVRVFLAPGARGGGWYGIDGVARALPGRAAGAVGGPAVEPHAGDLAAPMPGRVLEVHVASGDRVEAGARLLVIEAMKMEMPLRAPAPGRVVAVHVAAGDSVDPGQTLVEIETDDDVAGDAGGTGSGS